MLSKVMRRARVALDPRLGVVRVALSRSLCSARRLIGLRAVADAAARRGVPGAFIECGTYLGGSSAVIAERLWARDPGVAVYLFDVFTGMPEPGPDDPKEAWDDVGKFVSSPEEVRRTYQMAGLPTDRVTITAGLFERTLPGFASPAVSVLHVDCDWYEPVDLVLRTFYDKVSPGGTVIFDDYGHWSGCRKAVDRFLEERGLRVSLTPIDRTSHYFIKPGA